MLTSLASRFNAALYDPVLALGERRGMAARRGELLAQARGRTLEIGAGTGLNLAHYPDRVEALVVSEPDPGMFRRLERRVARERPAARAVRAGAEDLPFADGEFDTVVSTLVLCTVPDPEASVAEIERVLAPGGTLLFLEHVRAEDARLARRQDRLHGPWKAFAAGCHCNRDTVALLAGGFDLQSHTHTWRGMPRIVHPLVAGAAVRRG